MRNAHLAFTAFLGIAATLPSTAAAQSPQSPPSPSPPPPVPVQSTSFGPPSQATLPAPAPAAPRPIDSNAKLRNEDLALALSFGGTLLSWGLLFRGDALGSDGTGRLIGLAGTLLAPNFGHWYQGVPFTRGTGIRILSGVGASYGLVRAVFCEGNCNDTDILIFLGSALVYIAATVDDIIDAPRRARKHNRSLQLGVAPVLTNGSTGLALGGSF